MTTSSFSPWVGLPHNEHRKRGIGSGITKLQARCAFRYRYSFGDAFPEVGLFIKGEIHLCLILNLLLERGRQTLACTNNREGLYIIFQNRNINPDKGRFNDIQRTSTEIPVNEAAVPLDIADLGCDFAKLHNGAKTWHDEFQLRLICHSLFSYGGLRGLGDCLRRHSFTYAERLFEIRHFDQINHRGLQGSDPIPGHKACQRPHGHYQPQPLCLGGIHLPDHPDGRYRESCSRRTEVYARRSEMGAAMKTSSDKTSMELRLAEILSAILKDRRLTLREVSEASSVSISTLSEWQAGRVPKNPVQIAKVAKFLKVSLHHLLFGNEDEHNRSPIEHGASTQASRRNRIYQITIHRVRPLSGNEEDKP